MQSVGEAPKAQLTLGGLSDIVTGQDAGSTVALVMSSMKSDKYDVTLQPMSEVIAINMYKYTQGTAPSKLKVNALSEPMKIVIPNPDLSTKYLPK